MDSKEETQFLKTGHGSHKIKVVNVLCCRNQVLIRCLTEAFLFRLMLVHRVSSFPRPEPRHEVGTPFLLGLIVLN